MLRNEIVWMNGVRPVLPPVKTDMIFVAVEREYYQIMFLLMSEDD